MNNFILTGTLEKIHDEVFILNVDNNFIKIEKNEKTLGLFNSEHAKEGILIGVRGEILEGNKLSPVAITFIKDEEEE